MADRIKPSDLAEAAGSLRSLLNVLPAEEDAPSDAKVRRRVEGAIVAAELVAGQPAPRVATEGLTE